MTSPFPSLAQTAECQGTTSPQHGCKGPRSEPLELLRPNRKTPRSRCSLRKSGGGKCCIAKREAQWQKWVMGAGRRACRTGPGAGAPLKQHTPHILPPNTSGPAGWPAGSSPMYCIVPHMVNARPPRFSRRESPKSDKRR